MNRKWILTMAVVATATITAAMSTRPHGPGCDFAVLDEDGVLAPFDIKTKEPLGLFERIGKSVSLNTMDGEFRDVTQCLTDMGYGSRLMDVMPYADQTVSVMSPGSKDVIVPPADIDQSRI